MHPNDCNQGLQESKDAFVFSDAVKEAKRYAHTTTHNNTLQRSSGRINLKRTTTTTTAAGAVLSLTALQYTRLSGHSRRHPSNQMTQNSNACSHLHRHKHTMFLSRGFIKHERGSLNSCTANTGTNTMQNVQKDKLTVSCSGSTDANTQTVLAYSIFKHC